MLGYIKNIINIGKFGVMKGSKNNLKTSGAGMLIPFASGGPVDLARGRIVQNNATVIGFGSFIEDIPFENNKIDITGSVNRAENLAFVIPMNARIDSLSIFTSLTVSRNVSEVGNIEMTTRLFMSETPESNVFIPVETATFIQNVKTYPRTGNTEAVTLCVNKPVRQGTRLMLACTFEGNSCQILGYELKAYISAGLLLR